MNRIGEIFLILAVLIFSSSSSAFLLLNQFDGVTFMPCNVLCSSNMLGVVFLTIYFHNELTITEISKLSQSEWLWMAVGSVLYSAVGPYLFLTGLTTTDVPTAVIIQRMESLNFLALSYFFLSSDISYWTLGNGLLTLSGIALAMISPLFWGESITVSSGALYILCSGYAYSTSLIISKKHLTGVPVGVLAVFRVVVGTVLYHLLMLSTGGEMGALVSPKLWMYMLPYGLVYVFAAQVLWLQALMQAPPTSISIGTTCQFVLSLAWSAILVGTLPTNAQWIGSAVLTVSIVSGVYEVMWRLQEDKQRRLEGGLLLDPSDTNNNDSSSSTINSEPRSSSMPAGATDEPESAVTLKLRDRDRHDGYVTVASAVDVEEGDFRIVTRAESRSRVRSSEFDSECTFRGF